MPPLQQTIEAHGDFACFTSPVTKSERFSYPCPTPSAVRGIYDAIYCKPKEFRWQIDRIEILNPIHFIALRRNEVKEKISEGAVKQWMSGKKSPEPILADADKSITGTDQKGRTQRQTMALRDVRYRFSAHVVPWSGFEGRQKGLENQFRRRASKGKCVYQPCFGVREFPAYFRLVEPNEPSVELVTIDLDVGWMLYDVFDLSRPNGIFDSSKKDGGGCRPSISLFHAKVQDGALVVPPYEDSKVQKQIDPEGGANL